MDSSPPTSITAIDDLLRECFSWLILLDLPRCTPVSKVWCDRFKTSFRSSLQWRCSLDYAQEALLNEDETVSISYSDARGAAYTRRDNTHSFVYHLESVVPECFLVMLANPHENLVRQFLLRNQLHSTLQTGGSVTSATSGIKASELPQRHKVDHRYQNILRCGEQVFFLYPTAMWRDDKILADVLHLQSGNWLRLDITSLRDALWEALGHDRIERMAVSGTRHHFVIHINTISGAKVAGAIRLPNAIQAQSKNVETANWGDARVSFARRWSPDHPISKLRSPDEMPVEDAMLLTGNWKPDGLRASLLHSATGQVESRHLRSPTNPVGRQTFEERGIASLTMDLSRRLVCGCGHAERSLGMPPILLWDFETGLLLAEYVTPGACGISPQSFTPQTKENLLEDGLRFQVGDAVECRTSEGWTPGVIVACDYREDDWSPLQQSAPYQIRCSNGNLIYAPEDTPELIRRRSARDYARDYETHVSVCGESKQIIAGLFCKKSPRGIIHALKCLE